MLNASDPAVMPPITGLAAAKAGASAVAAGLGAGAASADPFAALVAMLGSAVQGPVATESADTSGAPLLPANVRATQATLAAATAPVQAVVLASATVAAPASPAASVPTASLLPDAQQPSLNASPVEPAAGAPLLVQVKQQTVAIAKASPAAKAVISTGAVPLPAEPQAGENPAPATEAVLSPVSIAPAVASAPTQGLALTSRNKPEAVDTAQETPDKAGASGVDPLTIALVAPAAAQQPVPTVPPNGSDSAKPESAAPAPARVQNKPEADDTAQETPDKAGAPVDPLTMAFVAAAAAQQAVRTVPVKGSDSAKPESAGLEPARVQNFTAQAPVTLSQRATVAVTSLLQQQQQPAAQTGAAAPSGPPASQPPGPVADIANASGLQSLTARGVTPVTGTKLATTAPVLAQANTQIPPAADQPSTSTASPVVAAPIEADMGAPPSALAPPVQAPSQSAADTPAAALAVAQQTVATPSPAGQAPAVKPSAPASRSQPTAQTEDRDTAVAGEAVRPLRSAAATSVQPVSYSAAKSDDPTVTIDRGSSGLPAREKEAAPALQTASAETQAASAAVPVSTAADAAPAPVQVPAETVTSLAAQIASKSESKTSRFDVKLTPEGLGQVNVSVEIGPDGRLSAKLDFERPEVASAMHDRSGELQDALAKAGFDLSGGGLTFTAAAVRPAADARQDAALGFGFSGQGAGQGGNASQNQGGSGGGSAVWSANAFAAAADLADQANRAAAWTPRANAQGVDVRV